MKNRLPIGTVVLLKGGKKRIMIVGFYCNSEQDEGKLYDYCGLLYPEGYLNPNEMLLFDHSQIEKVFYLGLSDDENKEFQNNLTEMINNLNK